MSPEGLLTAARRASHARLFSRRRRRRLLGLVGAVPEAKVDDLVHWAEAEVAFRQGSREVAEIDERVGNEEEAIARADEAWLSASRGAVSATAFGSVVRHAGLVSQIDTARGGGPGLPRLIAAALRGARGWACTALATKPNFPLVPGLFDLVVVDEASQCTLAAVLPLAYRAKRLGVVGDPNQLRPIVSIDERRLNSLAIEHGFSREDLHDIQDESALKSTTRPAGEVRI